jgi:hypothetical protein
MNTKRKLRSLSLVAVLVLVLSVLSVGSVSADSSTGTREWDVGGGTLCLVDPPGCPDVAMADNGDTITIAGSGTLSLHPKSVTGSGTFLHQDSAGNVLGSGTWTATQLMSFKSYGVAFSVPPFGDLEGGYTVIRIHLVAVSGAEFDGVLQVDCLLGNPPAGAREGFRLAIQGADLNFNKEVSGETLFVIPP